MDTGNCEDMDKHICTGGDQPWKQGCGTKMLRHYTTGCRMRRKRIWSTNMMRVRMRVQGLGRGWAAVCGAAGLGCFAVMAQYCVGVVELSIGSSGARMHAEGLNRVGRIVYGCVYCAHRVHSAEQVFGDTDGETGLLSMWETRTPEGTGGPEQNI